MVDIEYSVLGKLWWNYRHPAHQFTRGELWRLLDIHPTGNIPSSDWIENTELKEVQKLKGSYNSK